MSARRWLVAVLGLVFLAAGAAWRLAASDQPLVLVAPDPELVAHDGSIARLPLGQNRLLINFWATWCPPCRYELPLLNEVAEQGRNDFQIIGIAVDDPAAVRSYLERGPLVFDNFVAGLVEGVRLAEKYGNPSMVMPFSVLVTKEGAIGWTKTGPFADVEEILAFVQGRNVNEANGTALSHSQSHS